MKRVTVLKVNTAALPQDGVEMPIKPKSAFVKKVTAVCLPLIMSGRRSARFSNIDKDNYGVNVDENSDISGYIQNPVETVEIR
ncbi:hypothetical protein KAR48_16565 [bacterium]|nr:hypothetical protein [bacterium]